MDYLNQFAAIDKNRDGLITRRELFKYALSIGEDISMVDTWFKLFDAQDKGVITIEDVSRTLGVPPPKFYKERMTRRSVGDRIDLFKSTPDLTKGANIEQVEVYKSATRSLPKWRSDDQVEEYRKPAVNNYTWDGDMHEDERTNIKSSGIASKLTYEVTCLVKTGVQNALQDSQLAAEIGKALETQYGKHWHVCVSKKTMGCAFAHLPGRMVQLKVSGYFVVAYQTSDNGI
ncbi:hypothetical protein PHET_07393 [Paragonimus heterotremus]|uniref:EF-hand domain-containing protein n=1 Tax=Paragonimus heterotremus TaxID=100268 RepID=A0A8J4SZR4_9TREM|nr:hypothetical protein PHET_07393 [Paragonimus heterotremus]